MTATVSWARRWSPRTLLVAAQGWDDAAAMLADRVGDVHGVVAGQVDRWRGAAADAARADLDVRLAEADAVCSALGDAAHGARSGAAALTAARTATLAVVATARRIGLIVSDPGTVVAPPAPTPLSLALAGGNVAAAKVADATLAVKTTVELGAALAAMAALDADTARALDGATLDIAVASRRHADPTPPAAPPSPPPPPPAAPSDTEPPGPAPRDPTPEPAPTDLAAAVAAWPTTGQDGVAAQISAMTPEQRAELVARFPQQVGNTDGVPWPMRAAANAANIRAAAAADRALLARPEDERLAETSARLLTRPTDPVAVAQLAAIATDPRSRREALAAADAPVRERIARYEALLEPSVRTADGTVVPRSVIGFDPARARLVQVLGDPASARSIGVMVPGTGATVERADEYAHGAASLVADSDGEAAVVSWLDGPFPPTLAHAVDPSYAVDMAPRLAAFTEDVDRVADAASAGPTPREVTTTVIGHSYGGSIVGTAEALGMTADRVLYLASAGAGVGIDESGDWHNRNPDVVRYSMTAPGDPIEAFQGAADALGPHGADTDTMPGVTRLDTGRDHATGEILGGLDAHSGVLDRPSDARDNILAVLTGEEVTTYAEPPLRDWLEPDLDGVGWATTRILGDVLSRPNPLLEVRDLVTGGN